MEISIFIESVGFGGAGVGRLPDGRVCFVPLTLPGERALVRVVREKKSFLEAGLVRLTEASAGRVSPRCPIFGKCGGCAYQHIAYRRQLEIKREQVRDLLARIGKIVDAGVRPMLPSPSEWEYRNRISVHAQDGRVGFYGRKSHRIVPASHCPIATAPVNAQLAELAGNPPRDDQRITLRESSDYHGFSQVNPGAAEVLASAVSEMLENDHGLLVDAYCGAGFFSKKLVARFQKIIGIEWSAGAVRAAKATASENESYLAGAVETHLAQALESSPPAETALLLDPPAEGLSPEVIDLIGRRRPATLVYVSCDPSTLSRDLKKLAGSYSVEYVQPVDLFPQTAEIESAAKLKLL
ncbi:MAG: TRAM domain-containing protein [Verrucomicrobia bacterium]|nr:TRAM domain-containing protein [Verrucomicrobiota bacterium]